MSTTTNGQLCYGIMLDEDEGEPENLDDSLTVVNYCSESCPMYIVAIEASVTTASRGYPEQIGNLRKDWDDTILKKACEGLNTVSEPAWFLSSYWSE